MTDVHTLVEQARTALLNSNPREALALCDQVLAVYPKHVEAFGLSAEALREMGELGAARDRLLRVVSADPENVVALWGLSIIFEEDGSRDGAAWAIDRAHSLNPGHSEIAREFHRLTGDPPGVDRSGLARLRLRCGQFSQAIREASVVLRDDPERLDVQLILAEAFWRAGDRSEAVRVCRAILDDSPDCLKAKLILGHCLIQDPANESEGEHHLRESIALDPAARVATSLFGPAGLPSVLRVVTEVAPSVTSAVPDATPPEIVLPPRENATVNGHEAAPPAPDLPVPEPLVATEPAPQEASPAAHGASDVAEWLIAEAPVESESAADESVDPFTDPAWAELLTIDGSLDAESLDRLNSALVEMGYEPSSAPEVAPATAPPSEVADGENWHEVFAGRSGLRGMLESQEADAARREGQPPPAPRAPAPLQGADTTENVGEPARPELPTLPAAPASAAGDQRRDETIDSGKRDTLSKGADEQFVLDQAVPESWSPLADEEDRNATPSTAPSPTTEDKREVDSAPASSPTAGDSDSRLDLAKALIREGKVDEAVAELAQLIRSAPDLLDAIIQHLEAILQSHPTHHAAHQAVGDAYMRVGRFREAIGHYNWVLSQRDASSF